MHFFLILSHTGCLVLDPLLPFHSNIPCSEVTDQTCSEEDPWDRICLTCEVEYDWGREYDWREKTVSDGASIPSIDPSLVTATPFESEDKEAFLDAYFIAASGAVDELVETTIIYNHGRYASIEHYLPRVQMLHELGVNVFVWDYRGYGKSLPETAPESNDWMSDSRLAYDEAIKYAPNPDKMIVYGMSVGGFPAGEIAFKKALCAQIFEAAVVSVSEKIEDNTSLLLPGSFLTSGVLETDVKLKDTNNPTLILHGTEDDRISLRSARSFFDKLPEDIPKEFILFEGAGHGLGGIGGIPESGILNYENEIMSFLEKHASECLTY